VITSVHHNMTTNPDNAKAPTEANATMLTNPNDTKTPAEALETPNDETQDGTKTPVNPNKSSEPFRLSKANREGKKRGLKRKTHRSAVDLGRVPTNSSTGNSMNVTRRKSRRHKKPEASPEIIELSSDSEVEEVEETITKTKYQFDLVRIAVGKKVFLSECELLYDATTGIMELSYKRAKRRSSSIGLDTNRDRGTVRFSLSSESSEEFAYYSDVEDGSKTICSVSFP
jgi:hypothetical protein